MRPPSVPLNAIRQPAFLYDADGRIVAANDLLESLAGRSLAGSSIAEVEAVFGMRPPGGTPYPLAELPISRALRGEEAVDIPLAITASDGRVLHVLTTASPIRDGDTVTCALVVWQDVSGMVAAEAALARSEGEYRLLVEHAPSAIYEIDLTSSRFRRVNDAMCEVLGYTREELMAMDPAALLDDESRARFAERVRKAYAGESIDPGVAYRLFAKDGRAIWAELSVTLTYTDGVASSAFVIAHDITERKEAEARLRESEGRFRSVLDHSLDALYRFNLQTGRYEYVSPAFERVVGRAAEEMASEDLEGTMAWIHPDDLAVVAAGLGRLEETGASEVDYRLRDRTGRYRWVSNHLSLVRDESGRPLYRDGVVRDVTGQKEAEEALAASEARYRELFESMTEGFALCEVVLDAGRPVDYRFLAVNPAFDTLTGIAAGTAVGQLISELQPGLQPEWIERYGRVALTGEPERFVDYSAPLGRWFDVYTFSPAPSRFASIFRDVTEARQAEEAVRASEARLVEAQRLAKVGDWEWDVPVDDVVWSRETCAIFGRDPDLPAPSFWQEQSRYYAPGSWARLNEAVKGAIEAGEPYDLEVEVVRDDGEHRWVVARGEAVRDAGGALAKLRGTVQEITERRRMEGELAALLEATRREQERLQTLVNSIADEVWFLEAGREAVLANPAAVAGIGIEGGTEVAFDDLLASLEILNPDGTPRPPGESPMYRALQGEVVTGEELVRHRGTGELRYRQYRSAPVRDAGGSVRGAVAVVRDVTEQRRAAAQLERNEALLARVLDLSMDGIYRRDFSTGRYEYANPALASITGYSLDELMRMDLDTVRECVHPGDRAIIQEALGTPGGWSGMAEYRFRRRDGAYRWIAEHVAMEAGDDGRPQSITGVVRDVTERREGEEALREYAENLRRSNEDLERFAYVASHDLQEPLRSIVSFSQLLERRYGGQLGEDADEYIDFIVEGGNRMQTLILDLLAYARVNSNPQEHRPTDVEAVMAAVERHLDLQLREANATLTHDPLPVVTADPLQLEQVFENLVANAIKFRRPDVPLRVHVGARRTDGFWEVSVQDNGIGIEKEYFDRIFVLFQRLHTRETYAGSGIGLPIVKRIVDRHGGTIRVESTPGEGSTFFFTLPAA